MRLRRSEQVTFQKYNGPFYGLSPEKDILKYRLPNARI